jgi:hypothetical protein
VGGGVVGHALRVSPPRGDGTPTGLPGIATPLY